jgi:hypothetical protein
LTRLGHDWNEGLSGLSWNALKCTLARSTDTHSQRQNRAFAEAGRTHGPRQGLVAHTFKQRAFELFQVGSDETLKRLTTASPRQPEQIFGADFLHDEVHKLLTSR